MFSFSRLIVNSEKFTFELKRVYSRRITKLAFNVIRCTSCRFSITFQVKTNDRFEKSFLWKSVTPLSGEDTQLAEAPALQPRYEGPFREESQCKSTQMLISFIPGLGDLLKWCNFSSLEPF